MDIHIIWNKQERKRPLDSPKRMRSHEPGKKRKERLNTKIINNYEENYYRKLWGVIITENYQLVYQPRGKCEIYRDTGASKKL